MGALQLNIAVLQGDTPGGAPPQPIAFSPFHVVYQKNWQNIGLLPGRDWVAGYGNSWARH